MAEKRVDSKKAICVAIDVGGTNTRAQFGETGRLRSSLDSGQSALIQQKISTINELRSFITGVTKQRNLSRCAIGFGGPVVARAEAQMTNWPGNPVITIKDLHEWGLPRGSTLMLNDMEAGAFGVISMCGTYGAMQNDSECLYATEKTYTELQSSNKILLAPGTGFGTIGIVAVKTKTGEIIETPVASEVQHSPAFPLDPTHGALIAWLSGKKESGHTPCWEEFVSGRGLVNIYDGLAGISRITAADAGAASLDRAAWIAANAVARCDAGCEEALEIFYRCMGKVAQILALAFQPSGGIYLSGESTIRNLSFIKKSGFIRELHDNSNLRQLLKRLPVYVVTRKDLNIRGALWACRERIHLSHEWR